MVKIGGLSNERDHRLSMPERYGPYLARILEHNQKTTELATAKQNAEEAARIAFMALTEAETANRAKSVFLATISHELRTPLNTIIGFSDITIKSLLDPFRGVEKPLEYVRDINTAGHHLLDLIGDILDLAKIEAGELDLHEDLVDVRKLAGSCIARIKDRATDAGVTLHNEIPAANPPVFADEHRLKQALVSLAVNAVKFTPHGGDVRLTAGVEASCGFSIIVSDTGIGIDPANLARIQEPFTQVDDRLSRGYAGMGIGLSLAKALVELHDGTLDIESELGVGTRVTICLPTKRIGSSGDSATSPEASNRFRVT